MSVYSFDEEERIPELNAAYRLTSILPRDADDRRDLVSPWRRFFESVDGDVDELSHLLLLLFYH
jgi:hypothetical protein